MPQEAAGMGKASCDSRDALHQQLPPKDLPKRHQQHLQTGK